MTFLATGGGPIELELAAAAPADAARLLLALGRFDDAEAALDAGAADGESVLARAALAAARGELLRALALLEPSADAGRVERARALGALGRSDDALVALEGLAGREAALERAALHLEAGEPQPASVALPGSEPPGDGRLDSPGLAALAGVELELLAGEIEVERGASAAALPRLRAVARAWARLGEAHARLGNRWRALRSVTHALDTVALGGIAARHVAGIHYRAWAVYGAFGHADLAEQAIQAGHHRIIQIATEIDVREYREAFLLDQRDNRRLIAAWKGEAAWGAEIPRG